MARHKFLQIVLASAALGAFFTAPLALAANDSPINNANDIVRVANVILYYTSLIFWIVAGIATIYAGFLFATAAGSQEQVGKAKKQLLYAVIAMIVGIMAAGIPALLKSILAASAP